jgi:hypothetical protein
MTKQVPNPFDHLGRFVGLADDAIAALDPDTAVIYSELESAARAVEAADALVGRCQLDVAAATKTLREPSARVDRGPPVTHMDLVRRDLMGRR